MNRSDEQVFGNGKGAVESAPPRAHLYDYLIVIARYRWLFLAIVVGGAILVALYLLVAPQTFSAGATLLPPDKSEGMSLSSILASSTKLDFKALSENSSAETFVRILQSRTLADSLITRFNLLERMEMKPEERQLAIDAVIGDFSVTSDRQGFVDLSYDAATGFLPSDEEKRESAKLAAGMVNAAVEILDKLNREKAVSRARRSREFIGRMKELKRRELDTVQTQLLHFQQQHKAIALDKQLEASVEGLVEIQTQINKIELQLTAAQNEMTNENPVVQTLRKQLAQLKSQKTRLEGGQAGGDALGISLKNVPDLMRQLANLKLNLEVATQIYTYLEAQFNQEQIQEARELPTVTVMDYASVPIKRSAPRRTIFLIVAIAVLMVIALIVVFICDAYRRSWEDVDQLKRSRLRETLGLKPKRITTDISR